MTIQPVSVTTVFKRCVLFAVGLTMISVTRATPLEPIPATPVTLEQAMSETAAQMRTFENGMRAGKQLPADTAKLSSASLLGVSYGDGAILGAETLVIDQAGRYALELWATASYFASTPNTLTGTLLTRADIGNYTQGQQVKEVWTIAQVDPTIPANRYPTVVLSRQQPDGTWAFHAAKSISTSTMIVDKGLTTVAYEFFAPSLNHYFMTANISEAVLLAKTPSLGWNLTGFTQLHAGRIASILGGNYRGTCRFYGHPTIGPNSHFYTADASECEGLKRIAATTAFGQPRWNYEEIAFTLTGAPPNCNVGDTPVRRFYNKRAAQNDSNHRYTTDIFATTNMNQQGWANEGVTMCTAAAPFFTPAAFR